MFKNIKEIYSEMKQEAEERRKEEERIEKEKLEKERQRLMGLSEKELLVEILLAQRDLAKENASLSERMDCLEGSMCNTNMQLNNMKEENESFYMNQDY